jgi:hypothetical protein
MLCKPLLKILVNSAWHYSAVLVFSHIDRLKSVHNTINGLLHVSHEPFHRFWWTLILCIIMLLRYEFCLVLSNMFCVLLKYLVKTIAVRLNKLKNMLLEIFCTALWSGARSSIVGWGTMLQAGRSQVLALDEVDFLINLIFPAALWPWGQLSLWEKWVPGSFLV